MFINYSRDQEGQVGSFLLPNKSVPFCSDVIAFKGARFFGTVKSR